MIVYTLEVTRIYEQETGFGVTTENEEKLLAGVFTTREDALFRWRESLKGEWEDYDITEWEL